MSTVDRHSVNCCPACAHPHLVPFYRVDGIPIHSCLLMPTEQEAMHFPRADLELAVCSTCGFITNIRFDSSQMDYVPGYEDQQSFSSTFNRFAEDLASSLVNRFDLQNKHIVEVGCGKGDFLKLLCGLGNNRGTGIDPSIDPRQMDQKSGLDIEWVAENLSSHHSEYPADFICCRHTLEHVPKVQAFVKTLRRVIGDRSIPVFFEVPDAERILDACAFEDIYHEHCSYFTPGSLARLFRASDFEVTGLYRGYDDQYLMLEAHPVLQPRVNSYVLEKDVSETLVSVEKHKVAISDKLRFWNDKLDQYRGQPVALWGSGSKCVSFLSSVVTATDSTFVVDINPYRQGRFLPGSGLEIHAPERLSTLQPQLIIAMNSIYIREIQSSLNSLSVSGELLGL